MNRRTFLGSIAAAAVAPSVPEPDPKELFRLALEDAFLTMDEWMYNVYREGITVSSAGGTKVQSTLIYDGKEQE